MRKLLLFVWLLLPAAALAYHYGPGQDLAREDRAADAATRGEDFAREARAVAAKDGDAAARELWQKAADAYEEALGELPRENVAQSRVLRLERAKAQMFLSKLPDAHHEFALLVDELESDPTADPKLLADARGALANAQYYRTWLMRLEGAPAAEWEPEIEASRQNYKLLAEAAVEADDPALAQAAKEDLESAIRLARLDLKDLQGLPLPSQ
jgi:hypothetical protein